VFFSPVLLPCAANSPRIVPAPALMRQMVLYAMRWPLQRSADTATSVAYFECFARLCEEWITQEVGLEVPVSEDSRTAAIMRFTREHLPTVTLPVLCRNVGMSERSLRRHFLKTAGITWEEYRQRLRICQALDLLEQTGRRIGDIGAAIGYDNPAAFARTFRAVVGMTPSGYRRQPFRVLPTALANVIS
jgi:AraC-like DNA-binding protein